MSVHLARDSYGKHRVRVSKVRRPREAPANQERHEFVEVSVDVELEGDFAASFTAGDNRLVIATDTCKNTVYALAKDHDVATIESFGLAIAEHFLERYDHVQLCRVSLTETVWDRLGESLHGFVARDRATPTAVVTLERDAESEVVAGVAKLLIAKTTESGFSDFHRDEYRTLPDVDDRILATELTAQWLYRGEGAGSGGDFLGNRRAVVDALLTAFLDHYSRSVQETLYRMGSAALEACPEADEITLTMPNKHHLLAKLVPEGTTNDNEVFVVTDEPFGYISGTIKR
ncbi:factor-independent urate hydroxylase [Botrimarina mediterranea]|uniref:Uricase n=1 Tax=Botrimarina mediterranea TaxID=2528022 RepID=A0A518K8Q1_9BACT|nr:urate oxidase [Botrimarina mediterranea]QDV74174.1 Uricase [Botrimarina mediterranea]QDV78805.1 Uricase [Planctomycetes bacterium K2D]